VLWKSVHNFLRGYCCSGSAIARPRTTGSAKETDERETKKIIDTLLLLETWLKPPTVSDSPSSTQNWYLVAKESGTHAVFNMLH
jgi:hypothetical protein